MLNSQLKIAYLLLFVGIAIVRKYWVRKFMKLDKGRDHKTPLDVLLVTLGGIGMTIPLVYVFSSWLDFADYALPVSIAWAGATVFLLAIWLLHRSHADLGRNWTATLGVREEHTLVTDGVFRYVRHPMYSAHILWAIANIMILPNWLAGWSFLLLSAPLYLLRIPREERMMAEQFGDDYRAYAMQTGRLLPRLGTRG